MSLALGFGPGAAAATTPVNCTADPGALATALASASDGDTLAIQGTCNGSFAIVHDLTLSGAGGATLDARGAGPVLTLVSGKSLVVTGITITGGAGGAGGGGIFNSDGTLTLINSTVRGNSAGSGGGILNAGGVVTLDNSIVSGNSGDGIFNSGGALTLTNSTVSGNSASGPGAGILNGSRAGNPATLILSHSTVSGNSSADLGGGIFNIFSNATVVSSTISGNSSADAGGGILNNGTLTLVSATVSGNGARRGAGIYTGTGAVTLTSTIVVNQPADANCGGTGILDGGYNLENGTSCGFSSANNSLSNTNPLLDPAGLKDNGGPTETIALLPGSPALDAIPAGVNGCGTTVTSDQRGVSRPQGAGCDIGAFEKVLERPCLTAARSGPLTVSAGEAVCIGVGGVQTGPVTVSPGGSLDVEGGRINGPLNANGAAAVRICGAVITGSLKIAGTTGLVLVGGDNATGSCDSNTITGPVRVTDNRGGVEFNGNKVVGSVTIAGNTGTLPAPDTGPVHAVGNSVIGPVRIQP